MAKMTKADIIRGAIMPDMSRIQSSLNALDRYGVLYTHKWTQGNEVAGNILVLPNDPRFDHFEFIGLIIDMFRDYADNTGLKLKGGLELKVLIKVLEKLYKEGKC